MRASITGLVLSIALFAGSAQGWTLLQLSAPNDGLEITGWDMESRDNTLRFTVNYTNCSISDDDLNSAIDAALARWNSAASGIIRLERNGTTTLQEPEDPPSIYCDNDASLGVDSSTTAGIGGPGSVNTTTGELVTGRLVLNSNSSFDADIANLSFESRVIIITHEIGHVLGFGHTSYQPSVMYFDASGKTGTSFSQDDLDAIAYLYGRDEIGFQNPFGCGNVAFASGKKGSQGSNLPPIGALLFFGVLFLGYRAIRRA